MKKEYSKPIAEKVEFNYAENVVASGSCSCPGGSGSGSWFGGWPWFKPWHKPNHGKKP